MQQSDWAEQFRAVFDRASERYRGGARVPEKVATPAETQTLREWGCSPQEFFDFVEDHCQMGEPGFETILLISSARRDYFLYIQNAKPSGRVIDMQTLPPKDAVVDGIVWLPRIIVKARAKLRGEMPPELMYCCGGDRAFLRSVDVHPADFLREVWAAGDDDRRVVEFVKRHRSKG